MLSLYIIEVIKDIGTQPSLDKLIEAAHRQGAIIFEEMRQEISEGLTSLEIGAEVYRRFMSEAGAEISILKREDKSVTFLIRSCPFHQSFLDVGVNCGIFLKGLCGNLTLPTIQATLDHFDPRLKVEVVVARESSEDICLERIFLANDN